MEKAKAQELIDRGDAGTLCRLDAFAMESVLIELLYGHLYKMPPAAMNAAQRRLFLCMTLEDHCQADGLESLSEEPSLFFSLPETCAALRAVGAPKTAAALDRFVSLLPADFAAAGVIPDWLNSADDSDPRRRAMEEIDREISDYPDGVLREVYRCWLASDPAAARALLDLAPCAPAQPAPAPPAPKTARRKKYARRTGLLICIPCFLLAQVFLLFALDSTPALPFYVSGAGLTFFLTFGSIIAQNTDWQGRGGRP